MAGLEAASLYVGFGMDTSGFSSGARFVETTLDGMTQNLATFGAGLQNAVAPAQQFFNQSTQAALDFGKAIGDSAAVLGLTEQEIRALNAEILETGRTARAGPQAVAEAYYDIVGSVTDASQRVPILNEAIAASEAGSADLMATVKALTATMNSYQGANLTAAQVSDILTQTVNMGVGSMNEFAGALPNVTGMANTLKISFGDLAAAAAFLTTKGNTASEATTQLSSIMTAFLNPNDNMRKALEELGFASGQAAIEQLGLVGAVKAIQGTSTAGSRGIADLLGRVEALRGVLALTGDDFQSFATDFQSGVNGATAAARGIQNATDAAQLELYHSEMEALKIETGQGLAPALVKVVQAAKPFVKQIADFVKTNPKLVAGIGIAVTVLGALGAAALVASGVMGGLISVAGAVAAVFSPIGFVIAGVVAAIGLLYVAWRENFLGIRDVAYQVWEGIRTRFIEPLQTFLDYFVSYASENGLVAMFEHLFTATKDGQTSLEWLFNAFGLGAENSKKLADSLNAFGLAAMNTIQNQVIPAVKAFAKWFVEEGLPKAIAFVQNVAWPVIKFFLENVGQFALDSIIALVQFGTWFLQDGLPVIRDFITNSVYPFMESFFLMVQGAWALISPELDKMYKWFVEEGLPFIQVALGHAYDAFVYLRDFVLGFWDGAKPGLESAYNWMKDTLVPGVRDFIDKELVPKFELLKSVISGIWTAVQPHLTTLATIFNTVFGLIKAAIQPVLDIIDDVKKGYESISGLVSGDVKITPPDPRKLGQGAGGLFTGAVNSAINFTTGLFKAGGGEVRAGQPYIVGEREPELFVPESNGRIYNQQQMKGLGGGITLNGNIVIQANSEAEGKAGMNGAMDALAQRARARGQMGLATA